MTSQINYSDIDILYPLAGQDNNSQGFRDNFATIQAGLATAKSEITALQTTTIVNADKNNDPVVNDLNGSTLSNGYYTSFYGGFYDAGNVTAAASINLENGPVQLVTLTQNATLTFTNWPTDGCGSVKVHVKGDGGGVFLPTFRTENVSATIKYDTNYPSSPRGIITVESIASPSDITLSDASTLSVNMPIIFNQSLGGLVAGAVYYVKTIDSAVITLSYTSGGSVINTLSSVSSPVSFTLKQANTKTPGFTVGGESLLSATVTSPGTGYATPATVAISGGGSGLLFTAPVLSATYQVVNATTVNGHGGSGFAQGDIIVLNGNPTVTFTVSGVDTGAITSVTPLTNGGPLAMPISGVNDFTAVTGSGTSARLTVLSGLFGINIIDPGDGYNTTNNPPLAITITGSSSTDGTAIPTLTTGTADNCKVIEAWSYDNGATVFIRYLGEY